MASSAAPTTPGPGGEPLVITDHRRSCLELRPYRLPMDDPLEPRTAVAATRLPGDFHADPADRFLVAQARQLDGRVLR